MLHHEDWFPQHRYPRILLKKLDLKDVPSQAKKDKRVE